MILLEASLLAISFYSLSDLEKVVFDDFLHNRIWTFKSAKHKGITVGAFAAHTKCRHVDEVILYIFGNHRFRSVYKEFQ